MSNKSRSDRSIELTMPNEKIQKYMDKKTYAEFLRTESCTHDFVVFDKITEEQASMVRTKVASLPWDERAVIFLKFWDGLNIIEISDNLAMSATTVDKLLQSGLLKLKNNLLQVKPFEYLGGAF